MSSEEPYPPAEEPWGEQEWDSPEPDGGGPRLDGGPPTELMALVEQIREENAAILSRVGDVEETVVILGDLLGEVPVGGAWCWRYLDPYETAALLVELRDWVDWMVVRYEVGLKVLPCWYLHGPAIEELTALYVSWRSTYQQKPRAYSDDLTAFHDRWFWSCLERIGRYKIFSGCTPLKHRDEPPTPATTDPRAFAQFTEELLAPPVIAGQDAEAVHKAIDAGHAIALRPKDPMTPVKWRGTWWAVLANSPDGLWVPRPAAVCEHLEELLANTKPGATRQAT